MCHCSFLLCGRQPRFWMLWMWQRCLFLAWVGRLGISCWFSWHGGVDRGPLQPAHPHLISSACCAPPFVGGIVLFINVGIGQGGGSKSLFSFCCIIIHDCWLTKKFLPIICSTHLCPRPSYCRLLLHLNEVNLVSIIGSWNNYYPGQQMTQCYWLGGCQLCFRLWQRRRLLIRLQRSCFVGGISNWILIIK